MIVTRVEAVTKTKYKVYVDGQFAFILYKGELSRFHIAEDQELSQESYEKIRTEVILKRAKLRAMHLLNDMWRTEAQLREKLTRNEYPADIVEAAISYVKSFGYINDYEYARSFIESRKERKSRREIYMQLVGKGVSRELIDEAFEESYNQDNGILRVSAVTAVAMSDQQKDKLVQKLTQTTGKQIKLLCRVDKTILGGIRLDYNGQRLDGTVQHRLNAIRELLNNTVL